ncbi:MAG TPA: DUF924 family protein [Steroidobacteraceae bacterium]
MDDARRVREFWFGKLPLGRDALAARMRLWFAGEDSPELAQECDAALRAEFAPRVEAALRGDLASWGDAPRRRLSLILLLDQFPRNIYRGRSRAFAGDEQAVSLALSGMQSGADAALDPVERIFFYMPLQHCESIDVQDESVAAYRRLLREAAQPLSDFFAEALKAAQRHAEIVRRFGRFPHRNRILRRDSTHEEEDFVRQGESFGQD